MEELKKRLSPLALADSARSTHGNRFWKGFEPFLRDLDRSETTELIGAYIPFAKSFSGAELRSRQSQRGLSGFLQHHQPDIVKKMQQHESQSRIITV